MRKSLFKTLAVSAMTAAMIGVMSFGSVNTFAEDMVLDVTETWDATDDTTPDWLAIEKKDASDTNTKKTTINAKATGNMAENIFDGNTANDIAGRDVQQIASGGKLTVKIKGNAELKVYVVTNDMSDKNYKTSEAKNCTFEGNVVGDTSDIFSSNSVLNYNSKDIQAHIIKITSSNVSEPSVFSLKPNNSKFSVFRVELKYNKAANVVVTKDVTVSAKDFTTGDPISNITVNDGSSNVEAKSDNTYSLVVGNTYTVSADGYSSESFTVTDETTSVEFTLLSDEIKNNGKVLNVSNSGFTKDSANYSVAPVNGGDDGMFLINAGVMNNGSYLRVSSDNNRNIQFKVTSKAKVVFSGIKSSNNNAERTLQLKNGEDVKGSWSTMSTDIDGTVDVEAGTYTITTPDTSMQFKSVTVYGNMEKLPVEAVITKTNSASKVAVAQYNDKCYAVAVISKADAESADATKVMLNYTADASIDSDTVYTSVNFDKEYTAQDFLSSASADDYVFAAVIDGTQYDTDSVKMLPQIQKIQVSVG